MKITQKITQLPKFFTIVAVTTLTLVFSTTTHASVVAQEELPNMMDELDPFDPRTEELLNTYDQEYQDTTGTSPIDESIRQLLNFAPSCTRGACNVWAVVDKSDQQLTLYVNGVVQGVWLTSTGVAGHGTPNFDTHPNGRIYDKYTSTKFPGGDYNGLGNMPYAVFISGGFAIHGTGTGNWKYLGKPASHGCVRIHPDNAIVFNRLVRQYGVANTWITIQP